MVRIFIDGESYEAAEKALRAADDIMIASSNLALVARRESALRALEVSSSCVEARLVLGQLAELQREWARAIDLYADGMLEARPWAQTRCRTEVSFRDVGDDDTPLSLWNHVECRDYARARTHLAFALQEVGRVDEAIRHYYALLSMGIGLGVRCRLGHLLLEHDSDEEVAALLMDSAPVFTDMRFLAALASYRLCGEDADSPSRVLLREAVEANKHVRAVLLDRERPSQRLFIDIQGVRAGSELEAQYYARCHGSAWWATVGALEFLESA